MTRVSKILSLLAGLAIVASSASAMAGQNDNKPVKQHMNASQKGQFATAPRTMEEAAFTEVRLPDGKGVAAQVPTELWNHLSVQTDAQGHQRLVESSTVAPPAPVMEGPANE